MTCILYRRVIPFTPTHLHTPANDARVSARDFVNDNADCGGAA